MGKAKPKGKAEPKRERSHILSARVVNFKCIKEVAIEPGGGITIIAGDADEGKTSFLQGIRATLQGMEPDAVKHGASASELTLELTDARIHRITHADPAMKGQLLVSGPDGKAIKQAAAFIKALTSPAVFQPVEWAKLGGGDALGRTVRQRQQRDQLLDAMPLELDSERLFDEISQLGDDVEAALRDVDLADVDMDQHALVVCSELRKACYEHRRGENQKAETAEGALEQAPAPDRRPPKDGWAECERRENAARMELFGAQSRINERPAAIARRTELIATIEADEKTVPTYKSLEAAQNKNEARLGELREEMAALRKTLGEREAELAKTTDDQAQLTLLRAEREALQARKSELVDAEREIADKDDDVKALGEAADAAKLGLDRWRMQDAHDKAAREARAARERARLFDALVDFFRDTLPKQIASEMDMPVDGMTVDGDAIKVNGTPLHLLGTSEQITIGVQVAAAQNPRCGFLTIDGFESLGRADRLALAAAARDQDLQLIVAEVDADAKPAPGKTLMLNGEKVDRLPEIVDENAQ